MLHDVSFVRDKKIRKKKSTITSMWYAYRAFR